MSQQLKLLTKSLEDYMISFNLRVDTFTKGVHEKQEWMMKHIQTEIDKAEAQMASGQVSASELDHSKTTLNIPKDQFQVIIGDIADKMGSISASLQRLMEDDNKG